MTNSLRSKIQNTFIGSFLIISICAVVVLVINQLNVSQNQRIIKTMTMEYSLITLTDELIQSYNEAVKNPEDISFQNKYQSIRNNITNVIASLKYQIVSSESQSTLIGVENTIKKVILECDTGITEVKDNNFLDISNHFVQANIDNGYVHDNTQILLQKELEYLSTIQEKNNQTYQISLIVSSVLFIVIIIFIFLYASSFSKQIISPIEKLTKTTEVVSSGDLNVVIDQKLLDQNNEVGILSNSFNSMISQIKNKIIELNKSNEETKASKDLLENNNKKLEKLNQFMVGREIKMTELKQKIANLENRQTKRKS